MNTSTVLSFGDSCDTLGIIGVLALGSQHLNLRQRKRVAAQLEKMIIAVQGQIGAEIIVAQGLPIDEPAPAKKGAKR